MRTTWSYSSSWVSGYTRRSNSKYTAVACRARISSYILYMVFRVALGLSRKQGLSLPRRCLPVYLVAIEFAFIQKRSARQVDKDDEIPARRECHRASFHVHSRERFHFPRVPFHATIATKYVKRCMCYHDDQPPNAHVDITPPGVRLRQVLVLGALPGLSPVLKKHSVSTMATFGEWVLKSSEPSYQHRDAVMVSPKPETESYPAGYPHS